MIKKNCYLFILFLVFDSNILYAGSFADSLANSYLEEHPGKLVIGIRYNEMQRIFYYSKSRSGEDILPDSQSIFELGRLTETFTNLLFSDLCIHGEIGIDDSVQKYLPVEVLAPVYIQMVCMPAGQIKDPGAFQFHEHKKTKFTDYICLPDATSKPQPILLCYLSMHTSGLPVFPDNLSLVNKTNPYAGYSKEDMYEFLSEYRIPEPIGFDYNYSLVGTALLGHIMSIKMKTDFESLLVNRLLTPMKLNDTRIQLSMDQQKRLLTGNDVNGIPVPHWTFDILAPAAALHSSPSDMMRFLAYNISIKKDTLTDFLDFSHNARIKLADEENQKGEEIGLGWKISPLANDTNKIIWQSGTTSGFASYIGFINNKQAGVFILSGNAAPVKEMGKMILMKIQ